MRHGLRLTGLTSSVAFVLMASVIPGATVGAQAAVAPRASLTAAVAPVAPHTMYVSVANRYLTMPHRILAGTYFVQARTTDANSVVQFVRAPAGYTPRQFLNAFTRWNTVYNTGGDPRAAYQAFVHSVTFVGGADVNRGGVGTFAQGFTAGRYFVYEATYTGPTHLARIVELTVVGTPPVQTPVPYVGVARIGLGAPSLPSRLPASGWLKAIGIAPLSSLLFVPLRPGVTKTDLDTPGICDSADIGIPPTKACFDPSKPAPRLGGMISAGASVFWYYRVVAGDYITGNVARTDVFDVPFYENPQAYARFTVS